MNDQLILDFHNGTIVLCHVGFRGIAVQSYHHVINQQILVVSGRSFLICD
ncbi:MAG: hypothetical protein CENE_00819 [Candidatus Celerinatantimonas neptuna]|nr:MAG: hypothetical protein CENE_00819 [Candidatus Celerinatantimonas neptuna]